VSKAIETLMGEHRLIEQVLGSLETFAHEVRGGLAPERPLVADYAAFARRYADACHHGKEEDLLFARMVERGFSREAGPVAVMLLEHGQGRAHVAALAAATEGPGLLAEAERASLVDHALGYVQLLRQHIRKEDQILYPLALQVLSSTELETLEADFEAFDRRLRAEGELDRLEALAGSLFARFRPDPVRMAIAAEQPACFAR